jgi:tripartite motif-containing protein 2/3
MAGRHDGYLWHPRKVALLRRQRRYVICDRGYERSRMQIFTEDGKFFKKIYIQYIDIVAGIAVTENEDIVVVDSVTPTVFIIGQNDFLRSIDCTDFMEEPSDIAVVGTY